MENRVLELRDEGTFIALLAVDMNPTAPKPTDDIITATAATYEGRAERYLLRRVGYPCDQRPNILITKLSGDGSKSSNDPYFWGDRTMAVAHQYIIENWHKLQSGDVVDVQFILGETAAAKVSERVDPYGTDAP